MHDFAWALKQMQKGNNVKRQAFQDTCFVRIQIPYGQSDNDNTKAYIQMFKKVNGNYERFPINLSCESILADDWVLVD